MRQSVIDDFRPQTIIRAGAAMDSAGLLIRPVAVIVQRAAPGEASLGKVLRLCDSRDLSRDEMNDAHILDRPDFLLLPPFVNSHAHLDLTHIGPRPFIGGFSQWVGGVMRDRPRSDRDIRSAIQDGASASILSGVGAVGDILGIWPASFPPPQWPDGAPIGFEGVSFGEMFGMTTSREQSCKDATNCLSRVKHPLSPPLMTGVQPHSPYSAGLNLYHGAVDAVESLIVNEPGSSPVLSTHLAETLNEDQFVRSAQGPFVDLLKSLGKWDGSFRPTGRSPVEYLEPVLARARWLVAHCNYVSDTDIQILARHNVSVAYCPIASAYFGHAAHRYRDMIEAGVNVCLCTDSILCQPPDEPQPMGIFQQARFLHRRDRADSNLLLQMATIHGVRALGLTNLASRWRDGMPAMFTCVRFDPGNPSDPWVQALSGNHGAELLRIA